MAFREKELVKLKKIQCLPPSTERKTEVLSSLHAYHIKIAHVEGLSQVSVPVSYHLQAFLFDQKYGTFVGSCWSGKTVKSQSSHILFAQDFYFYTSIPAMDLHLIIELITPSTASKKYKSCGWICLPLLQKNEENQSDETPLHYKVPLAYGSPLSLLLNKKPVKKKKKKKKTEPMVKSTGLEISLSQLSCPALLQISHLIPQNMLFDVSTVVPGLSLKVSTDPSRVFKPHLQNCITFMLERVCIRLLSSHEDIEKELLDQYSKHQEITLKEVDESNTKLARLLSSKASVVQRRLQVSAYNGYCFIQDPDIYHLHIEPPATPTVTKSLRRASSTGMLSETQEQSMVVRSDVKLFKIPDDPKIAILFLLEYIIALPNMKDDKPHAPSSLSKTPTDNVAVAWGFCYLRDLKQNPSQNIKLTSDPTLSPHNILFLNVEEEFKITFSTFSLLKQNKGSILPSDAASAVQNAGSTDISDNPPYFRPMLGHSTPKHKSVADIPMSIRNSEISNIEKFDSDVSRQENGMALQEVTLVPTSLPLVPPLLHSFPLSPGESFKSFTKLYWDKLEPVLDHSGKPAFIIDSSVPYRIDVDLELRSPLQRNEYSIQLLALSGLKDFIEVPPEVFFTFQFYRFLPIRTESLLLKTLSKKGDDVGPKSSLVYAFVRGNEKDKVPGFQISYNIDPSELKEGEYKSFFNYIMNQILHIDIWNGESFLYLGTAALPLKYFCRQSKEAVTVNLELDINNCEYPDESFGQVNMPAKQSLGKLHVRIASIWHPLSTKTLETLEEKERNIDSVVIFSKIDDQRNIMPPFTVSKAKRITETNRELSQLLSSRNSANNSKNMDPDPKLTEERRRKLARMEAVRNKENDHQPSSYKSDLQHFFQERERDLLSIETYIQKNKNELIQSFLHKSVTSERRIYPVIGTKSFFEFVFENPFPVEKKIEIIWKCPDLCLVSDGKEWQAFRTLHNIGKKVPSLQFEYHNQDIPSLRIQANEKVHIPFTYCCLSTESSQIDLFKAVSGHHFSVDVLSSVSALSSPEIFIKVLFRTDNQNVLAALNLTIQPLPPSFTHIFKFLSMEHSMFKKNIQISKDNNSSEKFTVKCSNSDVVCIIQEVQDWKEGAHLSIKAPSKAAGRCSEFSLFIYKDKYQMVPVQSWSVCVCPLQRIDLSCMAGQLMRSSLLIRGTHATNLVRCSSSSKELMLHPSEPFVLSPFAVQELSMNIRSLLPGVKYFQVTMVNQALDQILQSWLLVLSCQRPSISKAFQIHLSIGKETAKRITYTNPYPQERDFIIHSSHPHLLQLREYQFTVGPGTTYCMGLYFVPQDFIFTETLFLYLNSASDDKNEETYCIKVVCQ